MALTNVESNAALVVIDLQKGIARISTVHPIEGIIARAAQLARAFRERKLPVVLVNVAGRAPGRTDTATPKDSLPADSAELVPELAQQPSDYLLTKQRLGAFIGTGLDRYLREHGVTQIFLAGVSTSVGVESTARSAYDHGYHVVLVIDAITDRDAEAHLHAVEKIFPRIGETTTTDAVLKMLSSASCGPSGIARQ